MKDYTVIWVDSWMRGSHRHSLTKKSFVRTDSVEKVFKEFCDVPFIFEGFVPTLGEEIKEEDVLVLE